MRLPSAPVLSLLLVVAACDEQRAPFEPAPPTRPTQMAADRAPVILRGAVITPTGVLKHGYVGIVGGRIASVSANQPAISGARLVNTDGIVIPGFVDLHNHVPWNVLPRWHPPRVYANRYEWRVDPDYQRAAGQPFDDLVDAHLCEMNAWGELRALVGGTTSTMATHRFPCIHGLVRNLDLNSGFYGTTELDREHIINVLGLPPASDLQGRAEFVAVAGFYIANPSYEGLAVHVAEGTDATGSSNMLDELKAADAWNQTHLGGTLSARQLVDMVTSVPAHVAGIDDEVGALRTGLRADVVVLRGDANNPYGSVLRATPRDVQLVPIDGVPLYGDGTLMQKFWGANDLERIAMPPRRSRRARPA